MTYCSAQYNACCVMCLLQFFCVGCCPIPPCTSLWRAHVAHTCPVPRCTSLWRRSARQEALLAAGDAGISQTLLLTVPRHMDPPLYLLYTVCARVRTACGCTGPDVPVLRLLLCRPWELPAARHAYTDCMHAWTAPPPPKP